MKKFSIFVQWLAVLGLLGFVGYILLRPPPRPEYTPENWRSWEGLTVLSYAGIARRDEPRYPSVKRLEEHLTALRDAGYRTVQPEDVLAFLKGEAPLPSKALMLIFENGRKEAFIRATPVLQRTGFTAVIAVPTAVMRQWGGFYLKRSDIGKIERIPQWRIGSMGHEAIETIVTDAEGSTGRFLTHRRRLVDGPETEEMFQERILNDYSVSARKLEDAAGRAPLLYLYPFGDAGQSPIADPRAELLNREGVTRHYELAFIGGQDPFNGPESDPWALNRLRVPGTWTGDRLVKELEYARPRSGDLDGIGNASDWVFDGPGVLDASEVTLSEGSVGWLRGSDGWTDVALSASLLRAPGALSSLYARYAGPRSWLRVSIGADGLRVQERLAGRIHTLYAHSVELDPESPVRLRLRLRNNRAWVWVNDEPVARDLPLAAATRRGRVGFGSEGDKTMVRSFSATPLPSRWVLANSISLIPEQERASVQVILPLWFRAGERPDLETTRQNDLLSAARGGIRTIPLISGVERLDAGESVGLAETIDGQVRQAELKTLVAALALDGTNEALADALRDRGYRIVHVLPPEQAVSAGVVVARVASDEVILINDEGPEVERALARLLRVMPAGRLALLEPMDAAFGPAIRTARLADDHMAKEQ